MSNSSLSSYTFLIIALLCLADFSQANQVNISLEHIESYQAEYVDYEVDGENRSFAGSWTDRVIIDDENITRTVTRKPNDEELDLVRTVTADKVTLEPKYIHQRFGSNLEQVLYTEFKQGDFHQFYLSSLESPVRKSKTRFAEPPVEINLQGIFAAALPFHNETHINVIGYSMGAVPALTRIGFEIQGQETITINTQKYLAWKVIEPKSQWVYWVRKEFPYLIKVSHPSPNGTTSVSEIKDFKKASTDHLQEGDLFEN